MRSFRIFTRLLLLPTKGCSDPTLTLPLVEKKRPSVDAKVASQSSTIVQLRQQLHERLNIFFSDYAKAILWQDRQVGKIKVLAESDPPSIKITKHALFALQEIEKIMSQFGEVDSTDEQKKLAARSALSSPLTSAEEETINLLEHLYDDALHHLSTFFQKSIKPLTFFYDKLIGTARIAGHSSKVARAIPAAVRVYSHLAAILQIAQEAGLVKKMPAVLDSISQLISQTFDVASTPSQVETYIKSNFNKLPELFYDLIISSMSVNRPVAPDRSEQKQITSDEIDLRVVDEKPDFDTLPANCYVLVKAAEQAGWQLFQVNDGRPKYEIEIKLTDVPNLSPLLYDKTSIAELSDTDPATIKANLLKRWNVSVQERSEWLPLVEFARIGIVGTDILSAFLNHHAEKVTKEKGALDTERTRLIEKTQEALKGSIDSEGYYKYGEEETALSQSLKGIFNVIWSINQLSKGHWENPGFLGLTAYKQTAAHSIEAWGHYWKIRWPQMGGELGEFSQQILDAFLIYSKDIIYSRLQNFADYSHEIELQHHLRYGALTEPLRSYFDPIEGIYHERGLPGGNPFGYTKQQEVKLQAALGEAEEKKADIQRRVISVESAIAHYQACIEAKSAINKPFLLLHLATFQQELAAEEAEDAETLEVFQDELIASLSLEEKQTCYLTLDKKIDSISQSILRKLKEELSKESVKEQKKGWLPSFSRTKRAEPLTEEDTAKLKNIIKIGQKIKNHLNEEVCKVVKYTEALAQHKKMRTEFILRQLKQDGLLTLIDAARNSKNNPDRNIKKKRRLAILLADMNDEERGPYLQDAHEKATKFALDPVRIQQFVTAIYAIDPQIGHTIALETYLSGLVDKPVEEHLKIISPYEDLCNLLDRMPAEHVLRIVPVSDMFAALAPESEESSEEYKETLHPVLQQGVRAAVLLTLIQEEKIDSDVYKKNHDAILAEGLNENALIEALRKAYAKKQAQLIESRPPSKLTASSSQIDKEKEAKEIKDWELSRPETRLMNKIGLFLGRLAHANDKTARIVFEDKAAHSILYQECVVREVHGEIKPSRALYYESLVKTFKFKYVNDKYYEENRTYQRFLSDNQAAMMAIYKACHPRSQETESTILEQYQQDIWAFCELTENFIKQNLSHRSQAERSLREFFSALVLCRNNDTACEKMLQRHEKTRGSKHARYVELLTKEASNVFWPKAKEILCRKRFLENACKPLEAKKNELRCVIQRKDFDPTITPSHTIYKLYEKFDQFVSERRERLVEKVAELKKSENDPNIKCPAFQQEIKVAENETEKYLQELKAKIDSRKKDQARLVELNKKLIKIIAILTVYSEDNSSTFASIKSFFGEELPYAQQQLVYRFLQIFKGLQEDLYSIDGKSADEIDEKIKSSVKNMVARHVKITAGASEEKSENKKSLTFKVTTIQELSKAKEIDALQGPDSLNIQEALKRDLSFIEKIAQAFKSVSACCSSFFGGNLAGSQSTLSLEAKSQSPATGDRAIPPV